MSRSALFTSIMRTICLVPLTQPPLLLPSARGVPGPGRVRCPLQDSGNVIWFSDLPSSAREKKVELSATNSDLFLCVAGSPFVTGRTGLLPVSHSDHCLP